MPPRLPWRSAALALGALLAAYPLHATPRPPARPDVHALQVVAARAGLRPEALRAALASWERAAKRGLTSRSVLTVIDYGLPSRARRLWVLDLAHPKVLAHELVAHGRGTGQDLALHFSNRPGSLQSSLGTFLTGRVYRGKHGLALRLSGLDRGVNDRAADRAIVIHGASYVSATVAATLGRLGRSQGCPALSPEAAARVIALTRDGTVVFAYYPSS